MANLEDWTSQLEAGNDLSFADASSAAHELARSSEDDSAKKAFLLALSKKGETAEEVAAFASTFRSLSSNTGLDDEAPDAIDVCGTGGDGFGSFNLSSVVAFVLAASGLPVFKHGNRSITSRCGSADFVEALGVSLDANAELQRRSLDELNYVFFFAPAFHPAFREVAGVRKALAAEGRRSIFNLLGPLVNPGKPARQLVGVFSDAWTGPLAGALERLGLRRGLVVHGRLEDGRGIDELSAATENHVVGFGTLGDLDEVWNPQLFGLEKASPDELKGGDLEENLKLFEDLLDGRAPTGLQDSVLLNAGAALYVAERAEKVIEGVEQAREVLLGGRLREWMQQLKDLYAS